MKPETIKKLGNAFENGASVVLACAYAEISTQTYYNWAKKNPKLIDRFEQLRQKPKLIALQTVVKKIPESYGNAMDYLSRTMKSEYSTKEGSAAPPGEPTKIVNEDQLTRIIERAARKRGIAGSNAAGKK